MSKLNNHGRPLFALLREEDRLLKTANSIGWVEWAPDGTFKSLKPEIGLGLSLILDPDRLSFTWLTTTVEEIVEQTDEYIKFRTTNSNYTLHYGTAKKQIRSTKEEDNS